MRKPRIGLGPRDFCLSPQRQNVRKNLCDSYFTFPEGETVKEDLGPSHWQSRILPLNYLRIKDNLPLHSYPIKSVCVSYQKYNEMTI